MIATLEGKITDKLTDVIVLEVSGIGYGLLVPAEDYGRLAQGEPAKLYVYEHIREQAYDLFGFLARDTKSFFEQLLGVNGIGPKMALNMLSIGSPSDVKQAIAAGDVKFIQQANGVGKRVAERVVVELKDKVGEYVVARPESSENNSEPLDSFGEALAALQTLGFVQKEAERLIASVKGNQPLPGVTSADVIRLALRHI